MTPKEIAKKGTILRAVVGSTVHGLHVPGTDDRDEMGICIEPIEMVVGLQHFEQYTHRDQPEGVRSQPGDLDLVVYSLRKYAKLAAAGNPTILVLLFAEPLEANYAGRRLQRNANLFASRQAGMRFLGYLAAQRERLLGVRGQMRVTRTELIEQFGYDTKFAMHAVRLGYQGIEYLETGKLSLPMIDGHDDCMAIRRGEWNLSEVISKIESLEFRIKGLIDGESPLPRVPDFRGIDRLVCGIYTGMWASSYAAR